jgi:AbiV family abortive infection protein
MDLGPVRHASCQQLADYAVATAKNSRDLLQDAELLAGAARYGPAFSLATLSIEESGKSVDLAVLATMSPRLRAQVPLRGLLQSHALKLVAGLLVADLPFGHVAARLARMAPDELAKRLDDIFEPADNADRLKRRGFYVDLGTNGLRAPSDITESDVAAQLTRARQAADSTANVILGPDFLAWLAHPPPEGIELAGDLVDALTEAGRAKTPAAATAVVAEAVRRFREHGAGLPVTGPVVADRPAEVVAGMPRRHPLLRTPVSARVSQAADHDVTAAGALGRIAFARLPGHLSRAGPPRVPEPALLGNDG